MRITKLLAATALVGGLALTGAGTAQATDSTYVLYGVYATEASCTEGSEWWRVNHPYTQPSGCFYTSPPEYNYATGWYHWVLQDNT